MKRNAGLSWLWWHITVILILWRLRRKDHELQDRLKIIAKNCMFIVHLFISIFVLLIIALHLYFYMLYIKYSMFFTFYNTFIYDKYKMYTSNM